MNNKLLTELAFPIFIALIYLGDFFAKDKMPQEMNLILMGMFFAYLLAHVVGVARRALSPSIMIAGLVVSIIVIFFIFGILPGL